MSLTKPPCYDTQTRTDCPRRREDCKVDCPEWRTWTSTHEAELEAIRRERAKLNDAVGFAASRKDRKRKLAQVRYDQERRNLR